MTKPILFISPGACTLGSQVMLEFLKIPYSVCITTPETRQSAAFRKISPLGKVGALQDGDLCTTENAAILLYLSDKYGKDNLTTFAVGSPERTKAHQWLSYLASELHISFAQLLFMPLDPAIAKQFQISAKTKLCTKLEYVNNYLSTHNYFVGSNPSFVDAQAYGILRWGQSEKAKTANIILSDYPHIIKFLETMEKLPEMQNALAIENKNLTKVVNSKFANYFDLTS